jgi:hypothetical protein
MSGLISTNGTYYNSLTGQTLSGEYILGSSGEDIDASYNIKTSQDNNLYITPFIASMYADASGTVGVLKQTTVEIVDIDKIFYATLANETDYKGILEGFMVTDLDATDASNNAHVKVDALQDPPKVAAFKAALMKAIDAATDSTTPGGKALTAWLKEETQKDVTRLLSFDTLANLLEASVLRSFAIALDSSGGSANMWTALSTNPVANPLEDETAARRRALFTQLKEENVEKYVHIHDPSGMGVSGERINVLNFLPFVNGDKLAFVFDVVVGQYDSSVPVPTAPTSGAYIGRVVGDAKISNPGESPFPGGDYIIGGQVESNFQTGSLTIAKPSMRRVAVQITLGAEGGAAAGTPFAFTVNNAANPTSASLAAAGPQ